MTAYAIVRFRPKVGQEEAFVSRFQSLPRNFDGLRKFALIKAANGVYCSVAEWDSLGDIVAARPLMKNNLDQFRDTLQDVVEGEVTDPISGEAVMENILR